MAVVTITRTPWQDDDGTGTTGTVINNAEKTALYNQIDQALAQLVPIAGGGGAASFNSWVPPSGTAGITATAGTLSSALAGNIAWTVQNTTSGAAAAASLSVNAAGVVSTLQSNSPAWTDTPPYFANGTTLYGSGSGGMSLFSAGGVMRFYTGSALRWSIDAIGNLLAGPGAAAGNTFVNLAAGALSIGNAGVAPLSPIVFMNANGIIGHIDTAGSATAYVTSSDGRLKRDRGVARSTTVLERTVVHEYDWLADDAPARGVFAQEAYTVAPFANVPGTDERDADGRLVCPWGTDYSKYVPDLIVGWQQHAAALAALRAELAALKGSN